MACTFRADLDRRAFLKNLALGAGGLMVSPLAQPELQGDDRESPPKRFVFFLQNHGFKPEYARPKDIKLKYFGTGAVREQLDRIEDVPLAGLELPEHLAPLVPYKERVTIVQGINGQHVVPYHGAGYGALGGVRRSHSTPLAQTIDCALAQALPAPFPLLGFGWEALPGMQQNPIRYCSSAWERSKAAPLYCNPLLANTELFGAGAAGQAREQFDADTELLDIVQADVRRMHKRLSGAEQAKFQPYLEGYEVMSRRRRQLLDLADKLRQHAPKITAQFTAPKLETDWWEACFEVGSAALVAGLTNVMTIASGLCHANFGSFVGVGMPAKMAGHSLGHSGDGDHWRLLHNYNLRLLMKLVTRLEAVPEGRGTMMDNTLIVYTSCHAESQHSQGLRWPFILIGNLGGRIRSGRFIHYPLHPHAKGRSINALYATLLHAAGAPRDHFNLEGPLKGLDKPGPLPELLA